MTEPIASPMVEQAEACDMLKCSQLTLHNMLADGTLPAIKPGREWVIPRAAFIAAINELAIQEQRSRSRRERPILQPRPDPVKRGPGRPRMDPLLVRSSQPGYKPPTE